MEPATLISKEILEECAIGKGSHVLCAFSGGADSSALLYELTRLRDEGVLAEVSAAHFHHGIRGAEADRDLEFCQRTAESLKIPFFWERGDVPSYASEHRLSEETAARILRYRFLDKIALDISADTIALAHHAEDQAETVLMHLIRGSGMHGAVGMYPRNGLYARPLLSFEKKDILEYCKTHGIAFVSDSSNLDEDIDRNRMRLCVFPELERLNPMAKRHLASFAESLRKEDAYLDRIAAERLSACGNSRSRMLKTEDPLLSRMLLLLIRGKTADYSRQDVEKLKCLLSAQSGKCIELTGAIKVRAEGDTLIFVKTDEESGPKVLIPGQEVSYGNGTFLLEQCSEARFPCRPEEAYLDADAIHGQLILRPFASGERFSPYGLHGTKLFSDYFTDKKIPVSQRKMPVVFDDVGAVYLPGYTVDNRVKVTDSTNHFLHIIYSKGD